MISSDTVGLVFRAKGDTADAKKAFTSLQKSVSDDIKKIESDTDAGGEGLAGFAESLGFSAENAGKFAGAMPAVGAALGVVTVAATAFVAAGVAIGKTLFDITKRTAEAGAEIGRFSTLTGFSTETVSALKIAADSAGTSIDEIEEVFESFVELMIEAGQGAEDAVDKLKLLNLDPNTAFKDLEGSFLKVLDRIREMPTQAAKAKVAMDGMGESGLNMIKVAEGMEGGTAAYIARLKEMGLVMDAEGVRRSKEFQKGLKDVSLQIEAITHTLGREFMPIFLDMAKGASDFFTRNRQEIRQWATNFADSVRGTIQVLKDAQKANQDYQDSLAGLRDFEQRTFGIVLNDQQRRNLISPTSGGVDFAEELRKRGEEERKKNEAVQASLQGNFDQYNKFLEDAEKKRREAEERQKQAEENERKSIAARIQNWQNYVSSISDLYDKAFEAQKEFLERSGNVDQYRANIAKISELHKTNLNAAADALKNLEAIQDRQLKKTPDEIKLRQSEQLKRDTEFNQKTVDAAKKAEETIRKFKVDRIDAEVSLREAATQKYLALLEEQLAKGELKEKDFIRRRQQLYLAEKPVIQVPSVQSVDIEGLFDFRKRKLQEELEAVKGNAEEEKRVRRELARLEEEIETERARQRKETIDQDKKDLETQRQLALELLEIRRAVLDAEREILNFRAEQQRKSLNNVAESSFGSARVTALIKLRDFETEEAERRQNQIRKDLLAEETAALERIKGKENEAKQKFEIEELYRKKSELSETEFQERLKAIREGFQPQITEAEIEADPFKGFAAGIAAHLENIALIEDANGKMQFSFEKMFSSITELGLNAFSSLAAGFGEMVSNWVLYGNTGGLTLQKLAAQIFSQLAAVATQYAIMCLAAAAFATTGFGAAILGGTPTQFLYAAAAFGALAVGAALVGRAIAGNSFNKGNNAVSGQTQGGFGSQTQRGEGGEIFTTNRDKQIIDVARNNAQTISPVGVYIDSKGGLAFDDLFHIRLMRNGRIRDDVKKIADG